MKDIKFLQILGLICMGVMMVATVFSISSANNVDTSIESNDISHSANSKSCTSEGNGASKNKLYTLFPVEKVCQVYPNPVSDKLFVKILPSVSATVSVYTEVGTLLYKRNVSGVEVFDFSKLTSGVYRIEVVGKTYNVTKL